MPSISARARSSSTPSTRPFIIDVSGAGCRTRPESGVAAPAARSGTLQAAAVARCPCSPMRGTVHVFSACHLGRPQEEWSVGFGASWTDIGCRPVPFLAGPHKKSLVIQHVGNRKHTKGMKCGVLVRRARPSASFEEPAGRLVFDDNGLHETNTTVR